MIFGYQGKILRVNLTTQQINTFNLNDDDIKKFVGGTGFGAKILYEEVPSEVQWNDPENRIIIASGPLGGTIFVGSGTFTLVTKGPMTNLAVDTQANGYFGAFLRLSGFDGIVIHGQAEKWFYLFIHDGTAELRNGNHLIGKDTMETEDLIKGEIIREFGKYRKEELSVFCIGPAGEKLVRFAGLVGDYGHICSKGGNGAVFGSKRLKAIVVAKGDYKIPIKNEQAFSEACKEHWEALKNDYHVKMNMEYGTGYLIPEYAKIGLLPVKNYTTNIFPMEIAERLSSQYMRTHFESKKKTCWMCKIAHNRYTKVTEGPYKEFEGEEPEYELIAAFGSQIWQIDPGATVMLGDLVDRLGMDGNESGWILGFIMECYEKGLLKEHELDGIKANWGDAEAARKLLIKIANREGIGNILAEGVKRIAEHIGGEALNIGVYTLKGTTPRGHDHRSRWPELLDSCTSNTSTIEAQAGIPITRLLGLGDINMFNPDEVAKINAKYNGWHIFENSLGVCRFCIRSQNKTLLKAVNAITGWSLTLNDALIIGKRIVNLLRAFNIKHGLNPSFEKPSPRYGSTPIDGPAAGKGIMEHFDKMIKIYRREMGWDEETGKPLPETLKAYGLEFVIKDIW
ncbi:MAG: aldehyde ferredoxin oxidoreductase C-terminal domain-containing protein [Nitrososphaerales archaeon]